MKILQIVHSFPPQSNGGTENYAYNLTNELSKKHSMSVFYRVNDTNSNDYVVTSHRNDRIQTFLLNNTFQKCLDFEMIYKNPVIDQKFSEVLDSLKPDIIHIHHLLFLSLGIIEVIKKRRIPVVFTLHDYWLECHRCQLLDESLSLCEKSDEKKCIKCLEYQLSVKKNVMKYYDLCDNILPKFLLFFFKNLYVNFSKTFFLSVEKRKDFIKKRQFYVNKVISKVDIFLAPSLYIKNKFESLGIPADKIIFSQCGILRDRFYNSYREGKRKVCFGFIGTFVPAKGLHILIDAFLRIAKEKADLLIFGEMRTFRGFETYLYKIKKLVKGRNNIKLMGKFDNENVSSVFSTIDALVVPSIWQENAPLVILESFQHKTPVIASNIGGVPELIDDGKNGMLFERSNVNDLFQKINFFINFPSKIKEFAENASHHKSIDENVSEIEAIYQKLISKN